MSSSYLPWDTTDSRNCRSNRLEVFCKKGALRNFAKFTGKHLCQTLFFNTVAGLPKSCNLIKKETLVQVFSCESCEISKDTFFHKAPLVAASKAVRHCLSMLTQIVRCYKNHFGVVQARGESNLFYQTNGEKKQNAVLALKSRSTLSTNDVISCSKSAFPCNSNCIRPNLVLPF